MTTFEGTDEVRVSSPQQPTLRYLTVRAYNLSPDAALDHHGTTTALLPDAHAGPPKLTWMKMMFICFVFTAGGPVGLESTVQGGGPLFALLAIVLVPVFHVLPSIGIVTELAGMMPTNHGSVRWITRAFGPRVGFVNSMLYAVINMIDLAIYPVLFRDYMERGVLTFPNEASRYLMSLATMLVASVPSFLSTSDLGNFSLVCLLITVAPFLVGFVAGLPQMDPASWLGGPGSTVTTAGGDGGSRFDIATLLAMGIWIYAGFGDLGSLGGEVEDHRVFLVGCSGALAGDVLMYLLPLLVTLQIKGDWDDGFFMTAFETILPGLQWGVLLSGAVSCFAMYSSSLTCVSRALWGIADKGWLPGVLTRCSATTNAPYASIVLHMLVCSVLMLFDFEFLVTLELVISTFNFILFYTSFVALRYTEPAAHRPWRVPGGKWLPWCMVSPIVVVNFALMFAGLADWRNAVILGCVGTVLVVVYHVFLRSRTSAMDHGIADGSSQLPGPPDDDVTTAAVRDALYSEAEGLIEMVAKTSVTGSFFDDTATGGVSSTSSDSVGTGVDGLSLTTDRQ
jgi:amino acid transporter